VTIQFITTNAGKFAEVSGKLAESNLKLIHLDRGYPEIQTDRLEKVLKFAATGLDDEVKGDYLIDDSGLFIEALGGFPGVYSAYVQKRLGNRGILKLLGGEKYRAATFQTVFLLRQGDEHEVFHGDCLGTITEAERGANGFGYDPIFLPQGETRTFAEMSLKEKNAISHRARAVDALLAHLVRPKEA
jgi:XTP/dITP diphosphohydrolase